MGHDTELLKELDNQQVLENLEAADETNSNSRRALTKLNIIIALGAVMCATLFTSAHYESKLSKANMAEREARKLNKETFMALQGLITDNAEFLLKSSKFKIKRNDGITRGALFDKDWSHEEKDTFIKVAHTLGHTNCLNWVKNQPNWKTGLCQESQKMVIKGPERYKNKTINEWAGKYYELKRHHYEDQHDEIKDVQKQLDISQSKLNAALSFIHDNPYYFEKVDLNHLGAKWDDYYKLNLDKAPNLKEYLFKKEQTTSLMR
jgi:hypothetical protein